MSKAGFIQAKLGSPGATAIIGGEASPIADVNDRPGWVFFKDATSAADLKINWYYYNGTYEHVSLKHMKSLFVLGSCDTWTAVENEMFFINVYTKMTGSGDAGAWYHSKHTYLITVGNDAIQQGERCIFYALEKPNLTFDGARHVIFDRRLDDGAFDPDSEILTISVHTGSEAPSVNVLIESMGVDFHQHQYHTKDRTINLKVIT